MDSKSFILHKDSLGILDCLTDEQAGKLFKAIRSYQDGDDLSIDDVIKLAFFPFKAQFDRDNEKYEKICNRNKNNGLKGGRPKTQKTQSVNSNPKKADSKNDSDNKKDSDSENDSKNKKGNGKDKDISITKNIGGLDYKAFNKYLAYRKEAGIKKLTKHGEELSAKKLVNIGGDRQMEVVDQSIGNGWSGLFELKGKVDNKKQTKIDDFNEWLDSGNPIEGECDVIN